LTILRKEISLYSGRECREKVEGSGECIAGGERGKRGKRSARDILFVIKSLCKRSKSSRERYRDPKAQGY